MMKQNIVAHSMQQSRVAHLTGAEKQGNRKVVKPTDEFSALIIRSLLNCSTTT
jgi:hypothetical protein